MGDIVFRITNLDSDPNYPIVAVSGDPPRLTATMRFLTDGAKLEALDWPVPDITISFFEVSLALTFDGIIHPACSAIAIEDLVAEGFREAEADLGGENPH